MILLSPPSKAVLVAFLERQRPAAFTYAGVGLTRDGASSPGFVRDAYQARVGRGQVVFDRARMMLERWRVHEAPGLSAYTGGRDLEPDQTVAVVARVLFVHVLCACRVVYIVDEARRFGFGYGTLPDHPECGEERFLIEWLGNDDVVFSLFSFSRPASPLFWLGYPVGRLAQYVYSHRYLQAMRTGVAA